MLHNQYTIRNTENIKFSNLMSILHYLGRSEEPVNQV